MCRCGWFLVLDFHSFTRSFMSMLGGGKSEQGGERVYRACKLGKKQAVCVCVCVCVCDFFVFGGFS